MLIVQFLGRWRPRQKPLWKIFAASSWLLLPVGSLGQNDVVFINLSNESITYQFSPENPNVGRATLAGDPSKPGIYVIRLLLKPGVTVPPHYHEQDRHVTVISGTWAFGKGESGDCGKAIPMPAGSYVFHPKDAVHYDGSCLGEEVIVQIIGQGPVNTFWIDAEH